MLLFAGMSTPELVVVTQPKVFHAPPNVQKWF
jgi:hypothetical protein